MYRLIHFECQNVIGIYNGLNKKHLELDLRPYRDKQVFIMLGGNAKGKTTLMSILHPFPDTTDKRDKFIRKGKEGYKELIYENQDDENVTIRIRHVYAPTKESHSKKCFIFKTVAGEEFNLNPNGNVSTFLLAVENEFGITEDFMRLSSQNEDMVSLVEMTSANRKDHMYKFIPQTDNLSVYQKVAARKYRDVNIHLKSIVDKLGKMADEVTVKEQLREIEAHTNELAEKRDKQLAKLNKADSEIKTLDPDDTLLDNYRKIRNELRDLNERQEKHQTRLNRASIELGISVENMADVDKLHFVVVTDKAAARETLIGLQSSLSTHKQLRANFYDSIEEKEALVRQLEGTQSKSDIVELLKDYRNRLEKYDSRIKKVKTELSADDLIHGIDIIGHLREFMYDVIQHVANTKLLEEACQAAFSNRFEDRYRKAAQQLQTIKNQIDSLDKNIASLSGYEYLKDTLDKRPKDCVIDSCAFLQDYHKWTIIEQKINTFQTQMTELNQSYKTLLDEMEDLTNVQQTKIKVESLLTFYRSNLSLLSKLPFNNKYANEDKLLACLMKQDVLERVEDNFYDLIEILQDKKEMDEIRNLKIPLLESELKNLDENHALVNSLKDDLKKLETKYKEETDAIERETDQLEEVEDQLETLSKKEELLLDIKERMLTLEDTRKKVIELSNEFDALKDRTSRIAELKNEMEERRQKLKVVEAKLRPLTAERDRYKFEEQKIAEYKKEQVILEQNLRILELVVRALSTSKGMPVHLMNMYVDEIRRNANLLLSETFEGSLYLCPFEIDEKSFTIPYQHNGDMGEDISKASSSERAFISSCLSMAVMEQVIAHYGILNLDEVDKGFSEHNKAVYCAILMKQIKRVGINQVFFITHSREYYEPYDVCYILFPEHNLKTKGKDFIKVY